MSYEAFMEVRWNRPQCRRWCFRQGFVLWLCLSQRSGLTQAHFGGFFLCDPTGQTGTGGKGRGARLRNSRCQGSGLHRCRASTPRKRIPMSSLSRRKGQGKPTRSYHPLLQIACTKGQSHRYSNSSLKRCAQCRMPTKAVANQKNPRLRTKSSAQSKEIRKMHPPLPKPSYAQWSRFPATSFYIGDRCSLLARIYQ